MSTEADAAIEHTRKFIRGALEPWIGAPHNIQLEKKIKKLTKEVIGEMIRMQNKEQMTLEDYLSKYNTEEEKWTIDHTLRVSSAPGGDIKFYIHPTNRSGDTLDFEVFGNALFEVQPVEPKYLKMEVANTALRGQTQSAIVLDEATWPMTVNGVPIEEADDMDYEMEEVIENVG